jgi:hypothetical protein
LISSSEIEAAFIDQVEEDVKKAKIARLQKDYDRYVLAASKASPQDAQRLKKLAADKLKQIQALG